MKTVAVPSGILHSWSVAIILGICSSSAIPARAQNICERYPIALSAQSLVGKTNGATLNIFEGTQPGNFGWLTWAGSPSEPTLVNSLTPPGDVGTYINPDNTADHQLNVGDWVQGKPGLSNGKSVRDALDILKTSDILVPVWNQTRGQGSHADYRISAFARIRILNYALPQKNISARFLGYVTCEAQNQAPMVNAGSDQTITLPDAAILNGTVTDDSQPAGGSFTVTWSQVSGPGQAVFTNAHATNTTASFSVEGTYILRLTADDSQLSSSDDVIITVNRANQAPAATPQALTTYEDTNANITLAGSDPDGDALTFTVVTAPSYGRLSGTSPNLVYTPIADYNGPDSFTFKASDGLLESAPATVSITVRSVDDAPVAHSQSVTNFEDSAFAIMLSGSDVDSSNITFILISGPAHGTLNVEPGALNTNAVTYTPNPNYNGPDSFTFKVNDGQLDSAAATVSITVASVNDAPDVNAGSDQIISQPTNNVSLVGLVTDDNFFGYDSVTVEWSQASGPGQTTFGDPTNRTTTATFDQTGVYVLRLTATDDFFESSDEVQVTFNAAPVVNAGGDQAITLPGNATLNGTASDDGLPLASRLTEQWEKVSGPGTVVFDNPTNAATTAAFSESGVYVLRLSASDSLVTRSDEVTVLVNRAPVVDAGSDQLVTNLAAQLNGTATDDNLPVAGNLIVTWRKVTGPGTVGFSTNAAAATATFSETGVYVLRLTADDSMAQTSDEVQITINAAPILSAGEDQFINFPDSISLTGYASDDGLPFGTLTTVWSQVSGPAQAAFGDPNSTNTTASFSAAGIYTLRLTAGDGLSSSSDDVVIDVNQAPVANNQGVTTAEDGSANIILTGNDAENHPLTFTVSSFPVNGTLSGAAPNLVYTPAPNFNGSDGFTFVVSDGRAQSTTATVAINVTPVNDAPVLQNGGFSSVVTDEDTPANGIVTATDIDSSNLTFTVTRNPQHGSVTMNSDGSLVYTPAPNFNGSDNFLFKASDGELNSDEGTVNITINAVNDAPVAANDVYSTDEDTGLNIPVPGVISNDTDIENETLMARLATPPAHGTVDLRSNGSLTYTPSLNFNGEDSFTYVANDGVADSATAIVHLVINAVNDAPTADGKSVVTDEDTVIAVTLTGSDIEGAALTFTVVDEPAHGTLSGNPPNLIYTPDPSYNGSDSFSYKASDGDLDSQPATVALAVNPINDVPVANAGADQLINFGSSVSLSGSATDIDNSSDHLTFGWSQVSGPGSATFSSANQSATSASFDAAGVYTLRLAVSDGELTGTDEIVVTVNQGPVVDAGPDQVGYLTNRFVLQGFVADDGFPGQATLEFTWDFVSGPGSAVISDRHATNAVLQFSASGVYVLRLTATDSLLTNSDEVTITVQTPNESPTVSAGQNQLIFLPDPAILSGSVTDDGLPQGSGISIVWSKISGPGEVTFDNANSTNTVAHFTVEGNYLLRLTATDGELISYSDVTIVVRTPANNTAPYVDAGADKIVGLSSSLVLEGTVLDDGLPRNSTLTIQWTKVSGPAGVEFETPNAARSKVTFDAQGTYVLRLSAGDSELAASDDITITVYPYNQPPHVDAGPDQSIVIPNPLLLGGNGLPSDPNVSLSASSAAAQKWNNTIGQPGVTGGLIGHTLVSVSDLDIGTNVYVGGEFKFAGGLQVNGLGRWDGTNWYQFYDPRPINPSDPNSAPIGMATTDSGGADNVAVREPEVFVSAGFLKNIDGKVGGFMTARWDGTNWQVWQPLITSGFVDPYGRFLVRSNKVYYGANFVFQPTNVRGNGTGLPFYWNLFTWDGTNWGTLGEGIRDYRDVTGANRAVSVAQVRDMIFGPDGGLYVGGNFIMPTPNGWATNVVKWNGTSWEPLGGGCYGPHDQVWALAFGSDGTLYAGGDITNASGLTVNHIAKWNGTTWSSVGTGANEGVNSTVLSMTAVGREIYIGGSFSKAGLFTANHVVKWDGEFWIPLGPGTTTNGVDQTTRALAANEDGVYVAGRFANAGGQPASFISLWEYDQPIPQGATLAGRVTDDGLPLGAGLSLNWSQISGPGQTTFDPRDSANSFATFDRIGTYVLRLSATDSDLTGEDDVTIEVRGNQPPTVAIDADLVIGLGEVTHLRGTVADDAMPEGASLLTQWSVVGGATTVKFGNPALADTTASFTTAGTYLLRLSANDSQFTTHKDVTITVTSANSAPSLNYASPISFGLGDTPKLIVNVSDDGRPDDGELSYCWTQISGPATVRFGNAASNVTSATFTALGTYVLVFTASDSQLSSAITNTITCVANRAPIVSAGGDQFIWTQETVLQGSVTDDDNPLTNGWTAGWSKVSGPGTVTFVNSNSVCTGVSFSAPGNYTLRLTATDGSLSALDDVVINMGQKLIVNAGPDRATTVPNTNLTLFGWATLYTNMFTSTGIVANWSKISGPGTVTWGTNFATNTFPMVVQAAFSSTGTYVLRLDAKGTTTSLFSDTTTVTVAPAGNTAPAANAGVDQTITWPNNVVTLSGSAPDDGLPTGSVVSFRWQQARGPLPATFSATNVASPTVTFATNGIYVFRLTANDGPLTNGDDVVITVNPPVNSQPVINAGPDLTITLPDGAALNATLTDDGEIAGTNLVSYWQKISGPGHVFFVNEYITNAQPATTAFFDVPGVYTLRVRAGEYWTVSDDVVVTVLPASGTVISNLPPVANAGPDVTGLTSSDVQLFGNLSDQDELPTGATLSAHWFQRSGPAKVYFADATSTNTTARFYATGTYVLRLVATDLQLSAFDDVTVTISAPANVSPFVAAGPDVEVTRPNAAQLFGTVSDDGLPLAAPLTISWSKVSGPGNVSFNPAAANVSSPKATFSEPGIYVLRISANDTQFTNTDDVTVTVHEGTNAPPVVNAGNDFLANTTDLWTLNGSVTDDGLPNGTLQTSWSKVSGPGTVQFSTINGIYYASFGAEGNYVLRLNATDGELTSSDDVAVSVYNAPTAPEVVISSPTDAAILTAPTPIIGTANSSILQSYQIQFRLKAADGEPLQPWAVLTNSTTPVQNAVLGVFDPTLLLNGIYELQLIATDRLNRSASTEAISLVVDRKMKVGNFSIAFSDLSIPVSGIRIEVIRTYDTRDKRVGDFGIGWNLGIRNIRLQKNRKIGNNWQQNNTGGSYALDSRRDRTVTITFPDGDTYKFKAVTSPATQFGQPITGPRVVYTALENTRGTLVSLATDADQVLVGGGTGAVDLLEYNGNLYNPSRFKFTTVEGDIYILNDTTGLESMTDRNGNTLTITSSGIAHSSGKSITFKRDSIGRITNIIDAATNVLTYQYDTNNNLVTFIDRENQTNKFTYDNQHKLLTIVDARNIQPLRNEYDDSGRLVRQIDAFGNTNSFTHDLAARHEIIRDRLGNVTVHEYDENGNVTRTTDALGFVTSYKYDANDNMLFMTNALGHVTSYTYDNNFNKLTETDPLGNVTRFTYNKFNLITSVTDPHGFVLTNFYDAAGNLLTLRDALGNTTQVTYDGRGKLITQTDTLGNVYSNRYDLFGNVTNMVVIDAQRGVLSQSSFTYDANGNQKTKSTKHTLPGGTVETLTTTYVYDKDNRLTLTVLPDGSTNATVYNLIGKPAISIDPLGRQTVMQYDARGNLTNTIHPDLTSESVAYDAENRKVAMTDRARRTTFFTNDPLGRATITVYPDSTATTNVYSGLGQIVATSDARGNVTFYGYDAAQRRTSITNVLGQVTQFFFDAAGNQTNMIDALGRSFTTIYDSLNRRTRTVYPDTTESVTTYDALSRRIAEKDQAGKVTQFGYDALGRLVVVTNAMLFVTRYEYDEQGSQTAQIDANLHTTRFEYDQLGRRQKRVLPAGQFETYGYDAVGNMTNKVDFNGYTTTYVFDQMNRLRQKLPDSRQVILGSRAVSYDYNELGLRTKMVDTTGTTTYSYDNRNRLLQKATPLGTVTYRYDQQGNLTNIHSSNINGTDVTYDYDALNRLSTVNDAQVGATTYSYDDVGNLQSYTYPNNITTSYQFDSLNRLTNMASVKLFNPVASYHYTVGAAGQRQTADETVHLGAGPRSVYRIYTYDDIYRLTGESVSLNSQPTTLNYSYDNVGNRLSRTVSNPADVGIHSTTHSYDSNDRLTSDTYDNNGNTTLAFLRYPESSIQHQVSDAYDFENRLINRHVGSTNIDIVYDGDGNRFSKTVNGVTTYYLVSQVNPTGYAQVLEELSTINNQLSTVRVFTYGHDLISQDRLDGSQWTTSFYGYDGHGNVRYLTDNLGNVTDTYDYDAFGNLIAKTSTSSIRTPNSYLYCGEQFDSDLGFYYLRARYLNPDSGRFWTVDPWLGDYTDPFSLHRYLYANANPVSYADPSGQITLKELGVTMAVGGLISAIISVGTNWDKTGEDFWLEIAKDAGIGAVTAPIGGWAAKGILKAFKPLAKVLLTPLFRWIGQLDAITLVGKTAGQKILVNMSRWFFNTNVHYPSVERTAVGKILKWLFPNVEWEQHHILIQQAWSRIGSSAQFFEDLEANEGLRRVANGLWNLIPIPASLNNTLGQSGVYTACFATMYYGFVAWSTAFVANAFTD